MTAPLPPRGRNFFFAPGPTNIPDRVLSAMHKATIDFLDPRFIALQTRVTDAVRRILRTRHHVFFYAATGHGAWEASLVNVFAPGETVLVLESGHFSTGWGAMARNLGLTVETLATDWRRGIDPAALQARLTADRSHAIKGILAVHSETSTGVASPLAAVRKALDGAKHPALLLADTISSLASFDLRMDDWGIDVVVGGSQKGLMMVTGLGLTGVSDKAMQRAQALSRDGVRRSYWDWTAMQVMQPQRFPGTTPTNLFYGLAESIALIEEEGLDNVLARHRRLATAARAAITHWGGGRTSAARISAAGIAGPVEAITLLCADPARASDSVSAILMPDGHDANALRAHAIERYNLSLGGGLGPLAGRVFRIGHLGDLNEPMLLGALATTEMTLADRGVPHQAGGVNAAIAALRAGA
jgi:alanine-glyoxylate transaminase/serine-glyoxylate transaminase/serine-pyruvate transaminase